MIKKNGFTLVELLAVIVILGLLVTMVTPNLMNLFDNKKEELYQNTIKEINRLASVYLTDNIDLYTEISENGYVNISTGSLCNDKLITCPIKDPRDNSDIVGYVRVIYQDNKYVYDFVNEEYINENVEIVLDNYGNITNDITGTYKEGTILELDTPTKEGHTFLEWVIVKGNSTINGNKLTVGTKDTIIWAKWQIKPLLTINYDNGEEDYINRHISGETIELEIPTKENYKFVRWELVSGNSVLSGNSLTIGTEDIVLKAMWELNIFELVVNLNGGEDYADYEEKYKVGETVRLIEPTKEGYAFSNWELVSEYGELSGNTFTIGNGIGEVKAIYTPIEYTITYNLSGGTLETENKSSYTVETDTFTLKNPTRDNYTFIGWTGSNGTSPQVDVTIPKGSIVDRNYIANWKIINAIPIFTYSSSYEILDDNDNVITTSDGNWKIRLLKTGTLNFTDLRGAVDGIDVFLVGGGGRGGNGSTTGGGGGGGGYTTTVKNVDVNSVDSYTISIGGSATKTTAFGYTANPGNNGSNGVGTSATDPPGGAGTGSGGRGGGFDGSYVGPGGYGGTGIKEFGESSYPRYYGGGGGGGGAYRSQYGAGNGSPGGAGGGGKGGNGASAGSSGTTNTGGGGGGGGGVGSGGAGGSGIVIIRNARDVIDEDKIPKFTYTGVYEILDDSDKPIAKTEGNWKIRFLTSGTLTFTDLAGAADGIDVFLVGGGGNGGKGYSTGAGGGGGGYTITEKKFELTTQTQYEIKIGGSATATNAFGFTAEPGKNGSGGADAPATDPPGGAGTGAGGRGGGWDGSYIGPGGYGGTGIKEFNDESCLRYYGGGGGGGGAYRSQYGAGSGSPGGTGGGGRGGDGNSDGSAKAGSANTGGGGGGGGGFYGTGAAGGSGIVIIRNAR